MKPIFAGILVALMCATASAQEHGGCVYGFLFDQDTGAPIEHAVVTMDGALAAQTDNHGCYVLAAPSGAQTFTFKVAHELYGDAQEEQSLARTGQVTRAQDHTMELLDRKPRARLRLDLRKQAIISQNVQSREFLRVTAAATQRIQSLLVTPRTVPRIYTENVPVASCERQLELRQSPAGLRAVCRCVPLLKCTTHTYTVQEPFDPADPAEALTDAEYARLAGQIIASLQARISPTPVVVQRRY